MEQDRGLQRLAYGLSEVAESLGLSVPFLRLEIRRGKLRPSRLGRRVVVTSAEVQRYLAQGMSSGRDAAQ